MESIGRLTPEEIEKLQEFVARRRWEKSDAELVVALCGASGLGFGEFIQAVGLERNRLWRWARQLRNEGQSPGTSGAKKARRKGGLREDGSGAVTSPPQLLPVRVVGGKRGASAGADNAFRGSVLEVVLGRGCVIRVPPDFQEQALVRLVRALEGQPC